MNFGTIPAGLVVRHKCDNPECTNPEHLELGTQSDNMKDCSIRGRLNAKSIENLKRNSLTQEQEKEIRMISCLSILLLLMLVYLLSGILMLVMNQ